MTTHVYDVCSVLLRFCTWPVKVLKGCQVMRIRWHMHPYLMLTTLPHPESPTRTAWDELIVCIKW